MHLHPRLFWRHLVLTLLGVIVVAIAGAQPADFDPIIDLAPVYLPFVVSDHPPALPPPLQAAYQGWLRKWDELEHPPACIRESGTPFYLEPELDAPRWLAVVAPTDAVPADELELNINNYVDVAGTVEYFSDRCAYPRLDVREIHIIPIVPELKQKPKTL